MHRTRDRCKSHLERRKAILSGDGKQNGKLMRKYARSPAFDNDAPFYTRFALLTASRGARGVKRCIRLRSYSADQRGCWAKALLTTASISFHVRRAEVDRLFLTARSADASRDSTNCRWSRVLELPRAEAREQKYADKLSFPSNAPWADPDSADRNDLPFKRGYPAFKRFRISLSRMALKRARRESASGRSQRNFRPRISGNTQRIQLTGTTFARLFGFQTLAMAPRVSLSLSARRHERRCSGTRDGVPARAMPRPVSSEETSHPLGKRPRRRRCLTDTEDRGENKTEEREKW